jgi:hypothetical protein
MAIAAVMREVLEGDGDVTGGGVGVGGGLEVGELGRVALASFENGLSTPFESTAVTT